MKSQFLFTILTTLFLLCSCKKDDFISAEEQRILFPKPTAAEIQQVYTDWQARDLTPSEYTLIQEEELLSGEFTLRIVSFKVNNIKEYGALIIPSAQTSMPVRMYVGGFGLTSIMNGINLQFDPASLGNTHIFAVPALRGQKLELTINGTVYSTPVSEGDHCDAFDGAADDVLAFLNVIEQTVAYADVNRTSVRGGSRGGAVALLAGIRDTRIKRVVDVVGPVNMVKLTFENENDPTYQCQFLSAYKSGQISVQQARNKMIASSPVFFAKYLPLTELHMGLRDDIVPVSQAYELQDAMNAAGKASDFKLFTYDKTHADIALNNADLAQRIEDFLSQL